MKKYYAVLIIVLFSFLLGLGKWSYAHKRFGSLSRFTCGDAVKSCNSCNDCTCNLDPDGKVYASLYRNRL